MAFAERGNRRGAPAGSGAHVAESGSARGKGSEGRFLLPTPTTAYVATQETPSSERGEVQTHQRSNTAPLPRKLLDLERRLFLRYAVIGCRQLGVGYSELLHTPGYTTTSTLKMFVPSLLEHFRVSWV